MASLAGPLAMGGAIFSWSAVSFKLEKINPLSGLKRIFSVQGLMELLKAVLRVFLAREHYLLYIAAGGEKLFIL